MPYLIILLSFIFVSCGQPKKINELSSAEYTSSLEQKSFLTINDQESVAYFRGKLLNSFVEEKFPSNVELFKIKNQDELKYSKISERDLGIYSSKENSSTKVLVSYSDHTEIFFLPENVPLEIVASKLNLKPESEKKFRWIKTNITKTFNGSVLYLVSLNQEDIVQNDKNFYNETFILGQDFVSKEMKLKAGKSLELSVNYEVLLQGEIAQQFAGQGVRCSLATRESGDCGLCSYTRNNPSSSFNKIESIPVNELGFLVKIGDQLFSINKFNPLVSKDNFKIEIDSSVFDLRKEVNVQLLSSAPESVTKYVHGYNFTGYCTSTSNGAEIGLSRKVEASVTATLLGRGSEFLKNVL